MSGNKKNKQKPGAEVQPAAKPKKPESKSVSRSKNGWMKWMVLILPFVLYANTLGNQYSMDDELVTTKANQVTTRGISAIPQIFTSLYSENETQAYEYRPIVLTSFAIEHEFFGVNPAASHFIQMVLYALLCFLIFKTTRRIFPQYGMWFHFIIAVLFIFHPLHTEVVASVKNRDEILAFIFALLSLNSILTHAQTQKWKYLLFGVLWFLLAWYSKLSAMPFAFIIPLAVYMANVYPVNGQGRISRKHVYQLFSYFAILILAGVVSQKLVYRVMFDPEMFVRKVQMFENQLYVLKPGFVGKLGMAGYTMAYYYKLLLVPNPLVCYYGFSHVTYVGWGSWMSVAGFIITAGAMVYAFLKIRTRQPWILGVFILLASLSMFANFVRPAVGVIAERFAFEASLGFCILLAWGLIKLNKINFPLEAWPSKKTFFAPVLAAILLLYGYKTITRNGDWYNKKSIYSADIVHAPKSAKLNSLLATTYVDDLQRHRTGAMVLPQEKVLQYTDSALIYFRNAVKVFPTYTAVNNNLGMFYYDFKNMSDSARYHIAMALKERPNYLQAHYNMGCMYEQLLVKSDEYLNFLRPYADPTLTNDTNKNKTVLHLDSVLNPVIAGMAQFKGSMRQTIRQYRSSNGASKPENLSAALRQWLQVMHTQTGLAYNEKNNLPEQITSEVISYSGTDAADKKESLDAIVTGYFTPYVMDLARKNADTSEVGLEILLARLYEYKSMEERGYRKQAYYHWRRVLEIDCRYQQANDKLNEWYKRKDEMDSAAALAAFMVNCHNYRKADAYWRLAVANLSMGDTTQALQTFEKMLPENDRMINRLVTSINHFSLAGNVQTKQALYNYLMRNATFIYRILQMMRTCYDDLNRTEDAKRMEERMIRLKSLIPSG